MNIKNSNSIRHDKRESVAKSNDEATVNPAKKIFYTAGVTAVWTEEESKAGILDGLERKESYETSGPFIQVRFFGGWDFPSEMTSDPDFVEIGYKFGVPMGVELTAKPENAKSPTFAAWALKDPESVNLERIQIIKGWYEDSHRKEKIYDITGSDNRRPGSKTSEKSVGNDKLSAIWTDPEFNPSHAAIYYMRVLEIPRPRMFEAKAESGDKERKEKVPEMIQDRAWTSPIQYMPDHGPKK